MKKILLIVLLLSACAFQRTDMAYRAKTELIGMSREDLVMCAGAPVKQERIDDLEILTYSGGGQNDVGRILDYYCEATFTLKDGIVRNITYHGRTGGLLTKDEQCGFIIENCIKH